MKHQTYLYVQTKNANYERKVIMKKMLRKSTAILSSALIASVLAVPSLTAFADENDTWPSLYDKNSTTLTLKKEIVITTEEDHTSETAVDVPDIIYTYTVDPVELEKDTVSVTDRDGYKVNVSSGVKDGLKIGDDTTAAFGNSTTDKKTIKITGDRGIVTDTFEITLDSEKFNTAGIYRYKITETADPTDVASAGIVRPKDYTAVRYVDVYVRLNEEGKAEIYGTVVFAEDGDVKAETTQKTEGFTDESDVTDPKDEKGDDCNPYEGATAVQKGLADTYPLMNYTVKKVVDGNTGTFDFKVTVSDANNVFTFDGNGESKTVSKGSADITKNLGNGGTIVLKDLPATASIAVSETNKAANNSAYMVTAKDGETVLIDNDLMEAGNTGTQGFEATAFATISNGTLTKKLNETVFTNTVKEISVTGVLFTVAPFAALAGVGTLFAGLFIKNRKRDDSNEII